MRDRDIPSILELEVLRSIARVGPREVLNIADGTDQTINAGAILHVNIFSDDTPSSPVLSAPGQRLMVGPDEALYLEYVRFELTTPDGAGKLQLLMADMLDSLSVHYFAPLLPESLPFTFPAVSNPGVDCIANLSAHTRLVRANTSITPGAFAWYVRAELAIFNTDGAAAHTYRRALRVHYRRVSGLQPLDPLIVTP